MKVALVHDYLNEFGGAEQVLLSLSNLFPEAPIYTAFAVPGSSAVKEFSKKKIVTSWMQYVPFYSRLYSPLRFLIPWVWGGFNFSDYDVVISSASWYVTKGFAKEPKPVEICYCHTPPRWLYGYTTSVDWQKYWWVRAYGLVVGHFLRMYDYSCAQKVTYFVANSQNVARRIQKFYRRDAQIIYPPVTRPEKQIDGEAGEYYLMVSRIVGGKGIELAIEAAEKNKIPLVIAGERKGYKTIDFRDLKYVKYLGRVDDKRKWELMAGARAFLGLSKDEDFGISLVEAGMVGTPVIAFSGGGYKESVVHGKTGILFEEYSVNGLVKAISSFEKMKWNKLTIRKQAEKFSVERFEKQMLQLVNKYAGITRD